MSLHHTINCSAALDIDSSFDFLSSPSYLLYVADGEDGLKVFDGDDPSVPVQLGDYPAPSFYSYGEVEANGTTVYITDTSGDLIVFNCSDPTNITLENSLDLNLYTNTDMEANSNWLLIPDYGWLYAFNISEPVTPVMSGYLWNGGPHCYEVEVTGNRQFTAAGQYNGIQIITDDKSVKRIAGSDRVKTALEVSRNTVMSVVTTVVLATAMNYPDALCAAPLAYSVHSPVLLTYQNSIPQSVIDEIRRVHATDVCVIGGPVAVSDSVVARLESEGFYVERIWGDNRYETAVQVARKIAKVKGTTIFSEVEIATGEN